MSLDIQHFKALLETEKEALEKQLQGIGEPVDAAGVDWQAVQEDKMDAADKEDVASSLENYENNESTLSVLESQLSEVKHALEKIEKGTYGICEVSGKEIELDRLEANPSARTSKEHMNG
jgi:RNA polymerase-binding transcription factor DksA